MKIQSAKSKLGFTSCLWGEANYLLKFSNRGFTLVELMVVITIIAILSSIGMVVFTDVLRNNRDQRRLYDLNTIKQALELYRNDNHYYPPSVSFGSSLTGLNGITYLDKIPDDANSNYHYQYRALPLDCSGSSCTGFALCAYQEGNGSFDDPPECTDSSSSGPICFSSHGDCKIGITPD